MKETGPLDNLQISEKELRLGVVNDTLDRLSSILATSPRTLHMDTREPAYGLLTTGIPNVKLAAYQASFDKVIDTARGRWARMRSGGESMPLIDFAAMDLMRNADGESFALTNVYSKSGGISRSGLIVMNDEGMERMYGISADENGSTETFQDVDMVDDNYKEIIRRLHMSDALAVKAFVNLYYGAVDIAERESALDFVRHNLMQSSTPDEADRMIEELRRRYELATDASKLRSKLGENNEMSNSDLLALCDVLDQRFSE